MKELYSIVVYPPKDVVSLVKDLKVILADDIGKFGSQNSEAHLTIANFIADKAELDKVIIYLNDFCLRCSAKNLEFIKFASFPTIFHLESSNDTKEWFKELVKRFNKHFPLNKTLCKFKTSTTPHITIGRELDALKISRAYHLFANHTVNISFICNNMTIRKFNNDRLQYDIFSHYVFGNKTNLDIGNQQLSLFD